MVIVTITLNKLLKRKKSLYYKNSGIERRLTIDKRTDNSKIIKKMTKNKIQDYILLLYCIIVSILWVMSDPLRNVVIDGIIAFTYFMSGIFYWVSGSNNKFTE